MTWSKRQKRQLARLLAGLLIALFSVFASRYGWLDQPIKQAQESQPGLYKVASFIDGDTITVNMQGKIETIRLIGVDTPETHDPRKTVQCFGQAAADFTRQLVGNNEIRLQTDPDNTNRDRYNRLLRYVFLADGRLVNAIIIEQGYGFAYTSFPFARADEFKALENKARGARLGLWGSCQPSLNEYGGYTSNPAN